MYVNSWTTLVCAVQSCANVNFWNFMQRDDSLPSPIYNVDPSFTVLSSILSYSVTRPSYM